MTTVRWWDVAFGGSLAAMAIVAGFGPADGSLLGAFFTLAALGLAYLGFGRRGIRLATGTGVQRPMTASSTTFMATVILGCGVGAAFVPNLATLQAIGFPLVWVLAGSYSLAVWLNAAVAVSVGLGLTLSLGGTTEALAEAGAIEAISFVFAIALGTWITRVSASDARHRRLLGELTHAQGELATLHHVAGSSAERERLADRFTQETGIQTDATVQVGDIVREVEVVLLRCVQEGLANVRQHSGAHTASVLIERIGAAVVLTVSDDARATGSPAVGSAATVAARTRRAATCERRRE